MSATALDAYRRYLECINARRFSDLTGLVHDTVTVNGQEVTRGTYVGGMVEDTAGVPDLRWSAEEMLAQGDTVAVRYRITGTPARAWRDIPLTGLSFAMQELIFYHFDEGRLSATWSLVDIAGARAQLLAEEPGPVGDPADR